MQKQYSKIGQAALIFLLLLMSITILYPVLHVLAVSFSNNNNVVRGEVGIIPIRPNLEAYRYMFRYNLLGSGFKNSLFILIVGTSINLLMTMMTAYPLAKKSLIGRRFFMLMITFTMMFSGGLIPNYIVIVKLGLVDSLWSLILPGCVSAYNMIIMKNFFEALPAELNEAARIDGMSEMKILFRIVVPLSLPSLCTIGLFYGVGHWNAYFNATIYLNSRSRWPLQVVLRNLLENAVTSEIDYGDSATLPVEPLKMAVVVFTTAPIVILYPFIQKYFVKGALVGSIKG
ncbi:MAG: carbohydrate ABC transporter permease [Candidatus Fimadaptatus sp.]